MGQRLRRFHQESPANRFRIALPQAVSRRSKDKGWRKPVNLQWISGTVTKVLAPSAISLEDRYEEGLS